jgi:hypothetical protein
LCVCGCVYVCLGVGGWAHLIGGRHRHQCSNNNHRTYSRTYPTATTTHVDTGDRPPAVQGLLGALSLLPPAAPTQGAGGGVTNHVAMFWRVLCFFCWVGCGGGVGCVTKHVMFWRVVGGSGGWMCLPAVAYVRAWLHVRAWLDGWVDGWMDGWICGWMDQSINLSVSHSMKQ